MSYGIATLYHWIEGHPASALLIALFYLVLFIRSAKWTLMLTVLAIFGAEGLYYFKETTAVNEQASQIYLRKDTDNQRDLFEQYNASMSEQEEAYKQSIAQQQTLSENLSSGS
ncbi:hypothetical protein FAI41_07600 [Acetobacteraceae bacterium]|nr:hypothetical protein FAI41_07600 [Acetobacteraceae bacterium]